MKPFQIQYNIYEKKYCVYIGYKILNNFSAYFQKHFPNKEFVLVLENATKIYSHHFNPKHTIVLEGAENCKTWENLQSLCETLIPCINRSTVVVALGGGALGDLVGFVSSILLRGVDWIFIPTTLLSQVDSSIGGKTAINSEKGKNLIGAFHPPKLVLTDTYTLKTLDNRQILSGYIELLKHALIADNNLFKKLEKQSVHILENFEKLPFFIYKSVTLKLHIINDDWFEKSLLSHRIFLNLGHTFGHAIEFLANKNILHGEAVALGILVSYQIACYFNECNTKSLIRVQQHLNKLGFSSLIKSTFQNLNVKEVLNKIDLDKKKQKNSINFVLPKGIGCGCVMQPITRQQLQAILTKENTFIKLICSCS